MAVRSRGPVNIQLKATFPQSIEKICDQVFAAAWNEYARKTLPRVLL